MMGFMSFTQICNASCSNFPPLVTAHDMDFVSKTE